jgi:VCBS repeat-containing protein
MATITVSNQVAGIIEGQTLTVNGQHGALVGDKDAFGYPFGVASVSSGTTSVGVSGGSVTITGVYGTLTMHADGSYSYIANNNISLPADGIVQDSFMLTITDGHGNSSQETLTLTVMRPGLLYVAGQPGQVLRGGSSATVFDASLGHQTVIAGNADNVLIGGANDILTAGNGNDTVIAGPNDLITLGRGNDTVTAGVNDVIVAGDGNDTVIGASNDVITLGNGNDIVVAGANDTVLLGNGAGKITVGANNSIRVGTGADTFLFNQLVPTSIGNDTIRGFSTKLDKIQFNAGLVANFEAVRAHAKQVGSDTVIALDQNNSITLKGVALSSLQASNFIFVGASVLTVTIDPVDGNNTINFTEAHAAGGVPLSGTVSGVAANSTFQVTLSDGAFSKSYSATVNGIGTGWTATIPTSDASSLTDGAAMVTAQVTDQYGNVSFPALQTVTVHETLPTVAIDPVDGNNTINFIEAHATGGVVLSGSVSGLAPNSTFQVTLSDGASSKSYTATVNGAGTGWTATISAGDAALLADGTATVTAQVTDQYGNVSFPAVQPVAVHETLPTVTIDPVDGNNTINFTEAHATGGVVLSGSVSGLAPNSTFQVTLSDGAFSKSYTATVNGAGTGWTATIPAGDAALLADGTATVTAQVTDQYGNVSFPAVQTVAVHETPPTVTIDAVDGNNTINFAEAHAAAGVQLSGTVTGLAANSTFVLTLSDQSFSNSYTATVNGTGTGWTATIPASDATTLADGTATLTAQVTDQYGNASVPAVQAVTVHEMLPLVPTFGLANADQSGASNQTQSSRVTLVGNTDPGDTVALNATGQTTLADTLGNFTFANVALNLGDNPLTVTARNAGGANSFTLDVTRVAQTATSDAAIVWNQITQQAIANDASTPEFAARALAMESLAVFDAVSAIDGSKGYLINDQAPSDANPSAAAAQAAHDVLVYLYPGQKAVLDALLAQSLTAVPDGQGKIDGIALGAIVAAQIIQLRANDGWNNVVIDEGSDTPGQWRPTPPAYMAAQGGQFVSVTPFALTSDSQFLAAPPPDITSAAYAAAVNETKSLGSATSTTRTADQTQIAKFWNDGVGTYTPPGQWNSIADQVALAQGNGLATDAQLLAELNVAEADAAVAAWNAKYTYNFWRPITAIQEADSAGNAAVTLAVAANHAELPELRLGSFHLQRCCGNRARRLLRLELRLQLHRLVHWQSARRHPKLYQLRCCCPGSRHEPHLRRHPLHIRQHCRPDAWSAGRQLDPAGL